MRALVHNARRLAQHAEAVRETGRNIKLFVSLGIEHKAVPLAESRGVAADVHGHVENLALDGQHQLALPGGILIVQAAQHTAPRERQIFLHKAFTETEIGQLLLLPGFKKVTALIGKHARPNEFEAGQRQIDDFHVQRASRPCVATSRR